MKAESRPAHALRSSSFSVTSHNKRRAIQTAALVAGRPRSLAWRDRITLTSHPWIPAPLSALSHMDRTNTRFHMSHFLTGCERPLVACSALCLVPSLNHRSSIGQRWQLQPHGTIAAAAISPAPGPGSRQPWESEGVGAVLLYPTPLHRHCPLSQIVVYVVSCATRCPTLHTAYTKLQIVSHLTRMTYT
eukprot:scaffold3690_cov113-Isochrysis_galbana.AAC.1